MFFRRSLDVRVRARITFRAMKAQMIEAMTGRVVALPSVSALARVDVLLVVLALVVGVLCAGCGPPS